jgi:hypothetical protein
MSTSIAAATQRFVRRTSLGPNEYRTNFRQVDCDVIAALISDEASKVTPHMSKIYLAFVTAPSDYWERGGVLRLAGREREGEWQTAWEQLVELVGVASATARKALAWMSQQGIIGYFAGRNGVGIRIFINRAASSIGQKPDQGQKNLRLVHTSPDAPRTSTDEVPFKESFAILEDSDSDLIPLAPENGAADTNASSELSDPSSASPETRVAPPPPTSLDSAENHPANAVNTATVVERIVREVVPQVKAAAAREQERTREWFITHALPKAIRVAQASAYDVLRSHGVINESRSRSSSSSSGRNHPDDRQVGKHTPTEITPRLLSDEEITELAESCVALLVTQGQSIDFSLSEMRVEAGGFLLQEDAPKVRAKAEVLTRAGETTQNDGREGNGC